MKLQCEKETKYKQHMQFTSYENMSLLIRYHKIS